jgi:hypothetical protein
MHVVRGSRTVSCANHSPDEGYVQNIPPTQARRCSTIQSPCTDRIKVYAHADGTRRYRTDVVGKAQERGCTRRVGPGKRRQGRTGTRSTRPQRNLVLPLCSPVPDSLQSRRTAGHIRDHNPRHGSHCAAHESRHLHFVAGVGQNCRETQAIQGAEEQVRLPVGGGRHGCRIVAAMPSPSPT